MQGWWWGWWLVRKFSRKSNQVSTDIQFVFPDNLWLLLAPVIGGYNAKNITCCYFSIYYGNVGNRNMPKKFKPLKFSVYCYFEGIDFLLPINSFSPTNKTLIKTWKWLVTTGYWQNNNEQRMNIQNSNVFMYRHWHCQSNFCFENKEFCFVCEWIKF